VRLAAHRLAVDLPTGWDGRIYGRAAEGSRPLGSGVGAASPAKAATLHAGNFPLPPRDGDFGTTATSKMPGRGNFVALTEYLPGNGLEAGEGLFAPSGLPTRLRAEMFDARTLLVGLPSQLGMQRFLTAEGRAFCLYVVLGGGEGISGRLNQIERLLGSLTIAP
jgi:hypothetical protein